VEERQCQPVLNGFKSCMRLTHTARGTLTLKFELAVDVDFGLGHHPVALVDDAYVYMFTQI
jgi:hypothetical protein